MFISDPDLDFLPIPDPGVKKAPDPGSGSPTLFFSGTQNLQASTPGLLGIVLWLIRRGPKDNLAILKDLASALPSHLQ